jgi:pimeloyl-ACP methyl ester carboxylesterase
MKWKIAISLFLAIIFVGGIYGWHGYQAFNAVPLTRLAAGSYYPEMPPDEYHHYLQIPIDHQDPSLGNFTDFYFLNPEFRVGDNVVFWLCDNQQEAVGLINSSREFDANLGGLSYVLIGNRGVNPTLFPEVFNKDGSVNYALAMKLYGSNEQIDDIEAVRLDMQKNGLLPQNNEIMVYGRSGGGVLVQQYLDKYGDHVSRALIEASGGPDLARVHNTTFTKNTYESNSSVASSYFALTQKGDATASLAFMLFMIGQEGDTDLQEIIVNSRTNIFALENKFTYLKNWLTPSYNFPLIHLLFDAPRELEVKVRMYELAGEDIDNYHPASAQEVCLAYNWMRVILADFMKAYDEGKIPLMQFALNRSCYRGEVMVWSGTTDQDFSTQMGHWISDSYPHSRLAIFDDGHHFEKYQDFYREFRRAFFTDGLDSSEVQDYFNDPRQLNAESGRK